MDNYNDSIRDMLEDIHFKLKFVNFLIFYAFLSLIFMLK